MEQSELLGLVTASMKEVFDKNQEKADQYVIAYYDAKDELLGYHADSFCNLVDEKLKGKRYSGENPYDQLATVRKNIESILSKKEEELEKSMFGGIYTSVQKQFNNLPKEEVFMYAEYLDPDAPKQRFKFKIM